MHLDGHDLFPRADVRRVGKGGVLAAREDIKLAAQRAAAFLPHPDRITFGVDCHREIQKARGGVRSSREARELGRNRCDESLVAITG